MQGDRGRRRRRRPQPRLGQRLRRRRAGSSPRRSTSFGSIDILVNNAGIVRDRTIVKMDESDYDAVIAVHQKGTFNTRAPRRPAHEGGRVRPHRQHDVVGRAAGQLRADQLRRRQGGHHGHDLRVGRSSWASYGITVNAMAPAGFTRMTENLYAGAEPPADQDPALNAPLVAFLASEGASYVNGQVLGRTGFAYTLFQTPRQIATMWCRRRLDAPAGVRPLPRGAGPAPPAGRDGRPPPAGQEGLIRSVELSTGGSRRALW